MASPSSSHALPGRLFRREISATVEIEAPVEAVWQVLVDLPRYPEWNSLTRHVQGTLQVGTHVRLDVDMPGRSRSWQTERVTLFDEVGRRFAWGLTLLHPRLLCTSRVQELTALPGGRTRYHTVDVFSGLLVPLVMALYRGPMQAGFGAMAGELRARVEANS